MGSRNRHVPVLESHIMEIDASRYNRVRLALIRLENPLRLDLTGVRDMDMILDDETWVCIDTRLNGRPVIAWSGFETRHRSGLHLPVRCHVDYYTIRADLFVERVMISMDRLLSVRLQRQAGTSRGRVLPLHFPPKG